MIFQLSFQENMKWDTDTADADTSSDSESENEASETVSTILKDLDQLDEHCPRLTHDIYNGENTPCECL